MIKSQKLKSNNLKNMKLSSLSWESDSECHMDVLLGAWRMAHNRLAFRCSHATSTPRQLFTNHIFHAFHCTEPELHGELRIELSYCSGLLKTAQDCSGSEQSCTVTAQGCLFIAQIDWLIDWLIHTRYCFLGRGLSAGQRPMWATI